MTQNVEKPARLFSPAQADALLPLVRPIAEEWQGLACRTAYRAELLRSLPSSDDNAPKTVHGEERAAAMEAVDEAIRRVDELRDELVRMGLAPQDAICGHLLFPSADRERGAYLSWLPGDASVANVLDAFEGPAARRPLIDRSGKVLADALDRPPVSAPQPAENAR